MPLSWIVTLPPLLVLLVAIIFRNVLLALATGILFAAGLIYQGDPTATLHHIIASLIRECTSPDHLYTFGFLIILGILIQLMTHSGGIQAYTKAIQRFLTSKRSAETTSLLISTSLFLDDYLDNLTTGAIMRPVTDAYQIPRTKLAFLLNSMSGPLCLLVPASSWVAFILGQMQSSGISTNLHENPLVIADPLITYASALPYFFYPILIIGSAWFIVSRRISYGKIYQDEQTATTTGNLFGGKPPLTLVSPTGHSGPQATLNAFIVPMVTFLVGIPTIALACAGWSPWGGDLVWYQALQNADLILQALCLASGVALHATIIFYLFKKLITPAIIKRAFIDGFLLMYSSLLVLLLAWTFGSILKNDLKTGMYVANILIGSVPTLLIPLICFLTATLITASTGSSWGTATIMLPIGVPLVASIGVPTLLWPVLGGIFSGMVAGSHISPITDATVVSASSAGCYHLDHVQSQLQYCLPALIGASIGFLLITIVPATALGLAGTLVTITGITGTILLLCNKRSYG